MPTAGRSHDVTLESGGVKLGFMLWRGRDGKRGYIEQDGTSIAPRVMSMGELTAAEFNPERELTFFQEDWRAGMGGLNHRLDPSMYASGIGIDATVKRGAQLARRLFAAAVDLSPNQFVPSGFGASGTLAMAFIGNVFYTWDYTNKRWNKISTPVGNPSAGPALFRNIVSFSGQDYVPAWVDTLVADVAVDDSPFRYLYKAIGSGTTWSIITGTNAQVQGCKYMAVANNKLWGGYWTDFLNSGNNTSEAVPDGAQGYFKPSLSSVATIGDILMLDSEIMRITGFDGVNNRTNVIRGYWGSTATSHAINTIIYEFRNNAVHHVRSTVDGTAIANWSSATAVGDSSSEITALVGVDTDLIVCKTDGVYRLKSDGTVLELRPELRAFTHPHNYRGAFAWQQKIFLPLGAGGLLELNTVDFTLRDISFSKVMPKQTQFHGRIVAGAGEPNRVWVLVQEASTLKYHLLMGEYLTIGGTTDYRWHHAGSITYVTGTDPLHAALLLEAIPSGTVVHHRVLAGVESTGSNLLPRYLPQVNDTEDEFSNATDNEMVFTVYDANLSKISKRLSNIVFTTENLGALAADNFMEVQFRVDGGAFAFVTGAQATSKLTTSPQTLTFSAGVDGKLIEIKTLPRRGTTIGSRPVLVDFTLKAQLRPTDFQIIPLDLYLADNQRLLNGASGGRPKLDLAQLRTWINQTDELTFIGPDGVSHTVIGLPGTLRVLESTKEAYRRSEYRVRALLAEV